VLRVSEYLSRAILDLDTRLSLGLTLEGLR
jgi:hypothetical protein